MKLKWTLVHKCNCTWEDLNIGVQTFSFLDHVLHGTQLSTLTMCSASTHILTKPRRQWQWEMRVRLRLSDNIILPHLPVSHKTVNHCNDFCLCLLSMSLLGEGLAADLQTEWTAEKVKRCRPCCRECFRSDVTQLNFSTNTHAMVLPPPLPQPQPSCYTQLSESESRVWSNNRAPIMPSSSSSTSLIEKDCYTMWFSVWLIWDYYVGGE